MSQDSPALERLKATLRQQESRIARLEAQIAEVQAEIAAFEPIYDERVRPIELRVQAVRDAINEIEAERVQRRRGADPQAEADGFQPRPRGEMPMYNPFRAPPPDPAGPEPASGGRRKAPRDLKTLYRGLARRFHPDLAEDEADRAHRNDLMALINEAYSSGDIDSLRVLEEQHVDFSVDEVPQSAEMPLETLLLRKLHQQSADLAMQIQDLQFEYNTLMHDPLMDLKIQVKLAQMKGRDLLQEMADDLREDYQRLLRQLDALRQDG